MNLKIKFSSELMIMTIVVGDTLCQAATQMVLVLSSQEL